MYLSRKDSFLSWGLEGGTYAEARKQEKSVVSYKDIFDGAELRCRIHGEGVKEDLILHKPEAVSDTYSCLYQMKNLRPVLRNNVVSFLDREEQEVFCVHAPCMKDAGGEKSEAIRLSLTETDTDVCRITFLPDMEWLGSENRLFPVVIDPVTTTSKKASEIYDAHVDSLYEEDNFQKSIILKNKGGDQVQRSFVRFALPEIKTGDMSSMPDWCLFHWLRTEKNVLWQCIRCFMRGTQIPLTGTISLFTPILWRIYADTKETSRNTLPWILPEW